MTQSKARTIVISILLVIAAGVSWSLFKRSEAASFAPVDRDSARSETMPTSVRSPLESPPSLAERSLQPHAKITDAVAATPREASNVDASEHLDHISLDQWPAVIGRIVDFSRNPVAGARGAYSLVCANGSELNEVVCDQEGRFRIALNCKGVQTLEFTIAASHLGRFGLTLTNIPSEGVDLGDLVLAPARDVEFFVHDDAGDPIEGCVATTKGSDLLESAPSDAHGHGVVRNVPKSASALSFRTLGFDTAVVSLAADRLSAVPLDVELRKLPGLTVAIVTPNGGHPRGATLVLYCWDSHPFVSNGTQSSQPTQVDRGASSPRVVRTSTSPDMPAITMTYDPDVEGRIYIPGLRPSGQLLATVEDKAGSVLVREEIARRTLEQNELVTLVVSKPSRTLELRIVDETGAPVVDARVSRANGGANLGRRTDADGVVRIDGVHGDVIGFVVSSAGRDTVLVRELIMSDDVTRHEVVLVAGRSVRVRCVDPTGRAVPADTFSAWFADRSVGVPRRDGDGLTVEFDDLPRSPFRWFASIGGRWFEQWHDTDEPTADILVPAHGSVAIEFGGPLAAGQGLVLRLVSTGDASVAITRNISPNARVERDVFPVVFPGEYQIELCMRADETYDCEPMTVRGRVQVVAGIEATIRVVP